MTHRPKLNKCIESINMYSYTTKYLVINIIMSTPPRSVGVGVHVTPITKRTPAQLILGGMFLFPRALAFEFCYDLDLCSQGQAVRAFFIKMGFS